MAQFVAVCAARLFLGRLCFSLCVGAAVLPVTTAAYAQDSLVRPMPRPSGGAALPIAPADAAPPQQTAQQTARPMPRPAATDSLPAPIGDAAPAQTAAAILRSPRPVPRPAALVEAAAALRAAQPQPADNAPTGSVPTQTAAPRANPNLLQLLFGAGGAGKVPRPEEGGALASAAPAPAAPSRTQNQPRKGSVCGDPSIRGEVIAPITSGTNGCGVADPVRVTEVAGVRLSQAVTVECDTVAALKKWIDSAMRPAFGKRDVVQLRIAAHYACRGRNNQRGARISEHGKGKALDISGFIFDDGTEWSISRDYNKQIRTAHKGACGIFGTTLGPGSDGFHEDHLHFDTASYRSGPYCR